MNHFVGTMTAMKEGLWDTVPKLMLSSMFLADVMNSQFVKALSISIGAY